MRKTSYIFILMGAALICFGSCKHEASLQEQEDKEAKQMLQGVWVNADDESLTMKVKGDTIYYADSTSSPAYFAIVNDSLVLKGSTEQRLQIVKQTEHVFQFKNATGDVVYLQKSDDQSIVGDIDKKPTVALNQNQLIKRDTTMTGAAGTYRVYTQVNPTTYRVLHSVLNDDGISVDNVYHDNIVHIAVYEGARKVYGSDIHKQDFSKYIPADYLSQSILSDILTDKVDDKGIHMDAYVCIPDQPVAYIVHLTVSKDGKLSMAVDK